MSLDLIHGSDQSDDVGGEESSMELLLLFAFAAIFAIGFNYAQPKVGTYFPTIGGNFFGATLLTAAMVMALLLVVSFVFAEIGSKSPVTVQA